MVELDRQLCLCTQRQDQSDVDYIKTYRNAIDAINDANGMAGATAHGLELVCQEQGIEYTALPQEIDQDGVMIPNPKKVDLNVKARERYLAALATSELHPRRHGRLKNKIENE